MEEKLPKKEEPPKKEPAEEEESKSTPVLEKSFRVIVEYLRYRF